MYKKKLYLSYIFAFEIMYKNGSNYNNIKIWPKKITAIISCNKKIL